MIYKLETIDRVINKIIRDLGLGQDEIPYYDFIEWIADALEHIGSYYQFTEKECNLIVSDYTAMLPCDFYKMIQMKQSHDFALTTDGGFYGNTLYSLLEDLGVTQEDIDNLPAYERFHIIPVAGIGHLPTVQEPYSGLNMNEGMANPLVSKKSDNDYNLNHNKITTGFRYGVIHIQYLAIPIDDNGFPMIPDDVSFRDALFWKVAYHLSMRNPKLMQNDRLKDSEYCRSMWSKYCTQARASANMPDLELMIRLKNNWMRLYNTVDDDMNGFKNLGKQQMLNFNGRY